MSILKFKKPDGTWESIAAIKGEPGKDGAIQYQAGEGIKIEDNVISADVTKEYIVDKIEELADMGFTPMIVESLPIDDIQTNTIYMIPSEDSDGENIYEEWMYINGAWEKVGSTGVKPSPIPVIVTSENIANNSLTLLDAPEQINTILPTDYNSISNAPMVLELITTSFANGMKHVLFEFDYTSSHTSKLVYVGYHYDTTNSGSLPTIYRCLLTINLSQSNGVYTCNRVSYSRAKTHQYLSTTNTTEFTPTSDYHPATKKYVDDTVANIDVSGDSMKGVYVLDIPDFTARSSNYYYKEQHPNIIATFENAVNKAVADGYKTPTFIVNGSNGTFIFECKDYDITQQTSNIRFTTVLNTNNENEIGTTTYISNARMYFSGTWTDNVYTLNMLGCLRGQMNILRNSDVLLRNNTSSFTPTSNYHPATKKYVDDAITSAISTTLGGDY